MKQENFPPFQVADIDNAILFFSRQDMIRSCHKFQLISFLERNFNSASDQEILEEAKQEFAKMEQERSSQQQGESPMIKLSRKHPNFNDIKPTRPNLG